MALGRLVNEIDAITECCICQDTYADPRMLPCVHTFCLGCLENYVESKGPGDLATCPMCREEFCIPRAGIVSLRCNFYVSKLIEIKNIALCQLALDDTASADSDKSQADVRVRRLRQSLDHAAVKERRLTKELKDRPTAAQTNCLKIALENITFKVHLSALVVVCIAALFASTVQLYKIETDEEVDQLKKQADALTREADEFQESLNVANQKGLSFVSI